MQAPVFPTFNFHCEASIDLDTYAIMRDIHHAWATYSCLLLPTQAA